jgi:hypothetical protein
MTYGGANAVCSGITTADHHHIQVLGGDELSVSVLAGLLTGTALFGKSGGAAAVGLAFVALLAALVVNVSFKKKYHPNYIVSIVKIIQPAEPGL